MLSYCHSFPVGDVRKHRDDSCDTYEENLSRQQEITVAANLTKLKCTTFAWQRYSVPASRADLH